MVWSQSEVFVVLDSPVVLTDDDRAKINSRARHELVQIIAAQAIMGLVVSGYASAQWIGSNPFCGW